MIGDVGELFLLIAFFAKYVSEYGKIDGILCF